MSYSSAYYQKNRDRLLKASKEYYYKHKQKAVNTVKSEDWYMNTRSKVKGLDKIPFKPPSTYVTFGFS